MATQTYKYFQPDTSLRAEYGGATIQDFGDNQEIQEYTLTARELLKQIGNVDTTSQLCEIGVDGSANVWFKCSDNLYPGISANLSTSELASVVSSAPAGYTASSNIAQMSVNANRTNCIIRGDSISDGLGTTSGDTEDVVWGQLITDLETNAPVFSQNTNVVLGENYNFVNMSIGSSSWANTNSGGGQAVYPYREDLAYAQRTQTHCIDSGIFVYWLGTNDLAYDTGLSAADCWTRASTRIAALAAQFPNVKIIVCTTIRRGSGTPLNTRINDYNVLMRANYLTAGAHILCDFEDNVSEVNIDTGDTTDTAVYSDGTHLTTAGQTLLLPTAKTAFQAAEALL